MSFEHTVRVDFADVDAAGIVYFTRIIDYCHKAWEVFLEERGYSIPHILQHEDWGAPVVHVDADFRRPLRHGDRVHVHLDMGRIGRSSIEVLYTLRDARGEVQATARIVHAAIDRKTFRPVPVPEEFRKAVEEHKPA